jgi:hypothetical protein
VHTLETFPARAAPQIILRPLALMPVTERYRRQRFIYQGYGKAGHVVDLDYPPFSIHQGAG